MPKTLLKNIEILHTIWCALALVMLVPCAVLADSIAPEVQVSDDGSSLSANGRRFDLGAASIDLVGRWGDRVLVAANSGGTGCPVSHYWLDLTSSTPAITDAFGACLESVDVTAQPDGTLVARSVTAPFVWETKYWGGSEISTERKYTFETEAALKAPPLDFAESSIGHLFGDQYWGPKILSILGEDEYNQARGYFSGPGQTFFQDKNWWFATGCGRGVCNKVRIAVAANPETDDVIFAFTNPYGDGPLPPAGTITTPLPLTFARFLGDIADYQSLKSAFNALSANERRELQMLMKERGQYSSSIDGLFGRGTATGIFNLAIVTAHEYGVVPDMQSREGARELVRRLLKPAAIVAPTQQQLQKAPAETPEPEVSEADAQEPPAMSSATSLYLFQGEWACREDGAKDVLANINLTDTEVEIDFLGTTLAYEKVTPLGKNGTAFSIALKNGQLGAVYELDDSSFLLNFSGVLLSCTR